MVLKSKESCHFEKLLHAKWSNFANHPNDQKNLPNFQGCWGKVKKNLRKMLLKNFKERPSKLEKGYSQVLVKQTVVSVPVNQCVVSDIK